MLQHPRIVFVAAIRPKHIRIRIPFWTVTFLCFALWATVAQAQLWDIPPTCNASAAFIDGTNPSTFDGLGWNVNVACTSTDPVVIEQVSFWFTITRVGGGFEQGFGTSSDLLATSYVGKFVPGVGCLPPGDYTWIMGWGCAYWGPINGHFWDGGPKYRGGPWPPPEFSGTFSIAPADSAVTLAATLVDPPTPQGNVKISYAFGKNSVRKLIWTGVIYIREGRDIRRDCERERLAGQRVCREAG